MTIEEMMICKNNGELVGRAYLRKRVVSYLSRWQGIRTLEERRQAVKETVDNDDWLRGKYGMTVGAVCRSVERHML